MSNGLILAVDQGTTNTKALAFDGRGTVVANANVPMSVDYPHPGWAEQSALDIWRAVQSSIAEVVSATGPDFDALGISNQRETIVLWREQTGEPIAPAVLWQCRRSAERCAAIRETGHGDLIQQRTGLAVDPLFPAAKIGWLLDNIPGAREAAMAGSVRAGTVDAWLLWKLTGGVHATDFSNASRTQLFDIDALSWDAELGRVFDVPLGILPTLRPSNAHFGVVSAGATALAPGVPVHAMIGDSHAALYGQGIRAAGTAKATYGTGSSLMTLTDGRIESKHGLSSTIAWGEGATVAYALEGNISVSGQAAAFMADLLGLKDANVLANLATTVPDSNGVQFVPALVGLGAPHWEPDARGLVTGLSLGTKRAHLARATIDAIACQVADVFSAMEEDLGQPLAALRVDGGASRNDGLMQLQADLIDRPVERGELAELSAAGAAMLAASGLGREMWIESSNLTRFTPGAAPGQRDAVLAGWRKAISLALRPESAGRATN
jgi:glycerol kinase